MSFDGSEGSRNGGAIRRLVTAATGATPLPQALLDAAARTQRAPTGLIGSGHAQYMAAARAPSGLAGSPVSPAQPAGPPRPAMTPGRSHFLGEFSRAEGTDEESARRHGYGSGYDVVYGYRRSDKPLTQMSLDEVAAFMKRQGGAMGRYQVIAPTLNEFRTRYGLTGKELFDPQLQDQVGVYLLNKRGYADPKLSPEDLQLAMSKEWASIEDPKKGASHYTYKVKDKATGRVVERPQPVKMSGAAFQAALARARQLDSGR